ncbi:tail length tape measure protein [Mycobacterium phage Brujita]|uniref:Tape measure protein n=2 Tax=Brujitavirus brujita TaxID=561996 RepID=B5U384_9CAUD|nr:tail length tape measure protein [Mycobacterium phage Brujita]ACI06230.1 tape measure protein [Mycobacterium phage Brujita]ADL71200.1 tape measure protein [Mycobacterium phage Island3]
MGIPIPVEAKLDERLATATAQRAEKMFADAGKNAGQAFSDSFGTGARDVDKEVKKVADKAVDAYDRAKDAAGRLRVETEKLEKLQREQASNDKIVAQAERVEKARRDEARAVRNAADAYRDYEEAANSANRGFFDRLGGSGAGASAGREAAESFADGFTNSSTLLSLGARGGPIGLALAGLATLGVMGGKMLASGIAEGLETLQVQDTIGTRMGLDSGTMSRFGNAAGAAYARGWGESMADNLRALQFGIQGGLISPNASEADAQKFVERLQTVSSVIEEDPSQIARGVRNFIKTGLVSDYEEAFDLIVAATQNGLNISNDLLDTFEEYGTKFRDLGITGQEALGLINQMWEGGARNVDVAADALKEFAISVTDSSDTTRTALTALGFDADDMAAKFAQGGPAAKAAFGAVLDAIRTIEDPMERERVGLDLFKTKWEDVGDAIHNLDLDAAAGEMGNLAGKTDEASGALQRHQNEWQTLGRNIDETFRKFKEWLADSAIGKFFNQSLPQFLNGVFDNPELDGVVPPGFVGQNTGNWVRPLPPPTTPLPQQGAGNGPTTVGGIPVPGLVNPNPSGSAPFGNMPGQVPLDVSVEDRRGRAGGGPAPDIARGPGMSYDDAAQQVADEKKAESGGADAKPSFDPSQYSVDAIPVPGSIPGMPGGALPGMPPAGATGPGGYVVDPQRVFDAETSVMSARQSVENARIRVLELEASGNATAQQLNMARQQVTMAERQYVSAQMKLAEAQQGTWKKMEDTAKQFSQGMEGIGAALDNDLGISKGLPGLAENLVKFLANLAAAPLLGQLSAISQANPIQGGHGLMGILGAQGVFGPQYTQPQTQYGAYPGVSTYPGGGGAYPGDAALLASVPAGRYSQTGIADLTKGIGDCSSAVEDLVNILDGRPTGGRSLSTHNADQWLSEHGFIKGMGGPGDFRVGFNASHMQATLPGGTPFNWGTDEAAARRGIGGTGADDPAFTSHYYRPIGAAPSALATPTVSTPAATTVAAPALAPSSSGPVPVTVTNWPQGGSGGVALPAPQPGATPSAAAGATGAASSGSVVSGTTVPSTGVLPDSVVYAPGNTNPGLTNPPAPAGGFGGGGAPLAAGVGMPQSAPFALNTAIGGSSFPAQGGEGFQGLGGLPMEGIMAATQGLDLLAPGASQAAQMGIKLANRAIGYAGQLAGIGVSGLMETFLPSGSPLANIGNSWFGKVAAGFAGARPALPNLAGQQSMPNPAQLTPGQQQAGGQQGQPINLEYHNHEASEDRAGRDIVRNLEAQNAPAGVR